MDDGALLPIAYPPDFLGADPLTGAEWKAEIAALPVSTAAQAALDAKQALSAKAQPNGYASLDGAGLVPVAQLPSMPAVVDWGDIGGTMADQPDLQAALDAKQVAGSYATGAQGALADTALQSIADGSVTLAKQANMATASVVYRKTAGAGVPEVNTLATLKTDLVLVKADVGLGNATDTSDANKPVSIAQQTALDGKIATGGLAGTATALATPRNINGVAFDGTANITVAAAGSTLTGSTIAAGMLGTTATTACAGNDARLSDARTPLAHKTSHENNGSDELSVAGLSGVLTDPQPPIIGPGAAQAVAGNDARLTDARTPTAHATSHKSGGSDAIKLDELAAPTDVTTLNADTAKHGLMMKYPGGATFLKADGTWATPAGGSGNTLYAPGSFTVATGNFSIFADELSLAGSEEATVEGTAMLALV